VVTGSEYDKRGVRMAISARTPNLASSESSDRTRITINLSEKARSELMALSGERSYSEMMRLALSVLKVLLTESKNGNRLVVVDAEGNAKREIIIPE